ncbi:response regulator transcription factor [Dyadobacter pollutisoli]|uniref:Response regulator n=1 Tax=Dyadobacter pollutisoli TaxID=2910158 RepID=A0A9E8SKF3_9BACT|nr:response regulator [Dyadobacter pollutisoli]WAC12405.1 response regulator [Dyadobacter pollutisoli]
MSKDRNILIVEDDLLLATDIKKNLKIQGWKIAGIAKNYESAMSIMKKGNVDLALIDIKLDGPEDGIMTATELLKIKWIPIIYITGNAPYEVKQRMRETYPSAFLQKPLRVRELSTQIDLAFNNYDEGLTGNPERKEPELLALPTKDGLVNIRSSEIIYVKAATKSTNLFLTSSELQRHSISNSDSLLVSVKFGRLTSQLPPVFFKLGRSETINLNHVKKIWQESVHLTSHVLTIPEGRRETLIKRFNLVER